MQRQYGDEKIRRVINNLEEEQALAEQNIYDGVEIDGVNYCFAEKEAFDGIVRLQAPMMFQPMPEEIAKLKYPSTERPQLIWSNCDGSVNLTLSRISNGVEEEQVPEVKDGIKQLFRKLNPSYLFYDEGVETIDGKTVGFFEFKSPALDMQLFNLLFVAQWQGDVLMGTFCCPYDQYKPWRNVARQIMRSLRVADKQGGQGK